MADNLPDYVQAARVLCGQKRPYLASLLFRLTPVASPGLKTMAVDQYARLYFDPEIEWTVPQTATVLYHEVSHLLRDHSGRGKALNIGPENAQAWNVVADMEINDDIEQERINGHKLEWPHQPCLPKDMKFPDGLMAEEYYAKLPKTKMLMLGHTGKGAGGGKCGGCAGNPGANEKDNAPESDGGTSKVPGLGQAEMEAVRHKVASDIREHQRTRGNVPGHLQEWATSILDPKVDWRKVLRAAIRSAVSYAQGLSDYSYHRPSRRQHSQPKIVLPTLRQPVPNIAVVVDTSGSMSNDDLATVLGEVNGILKQCGQQDGVEAIVCDAAVHSAKRVFKAERIMIQGRGGTDMRVGIEAALARPIRPHAIIVLTDGETPWPDSEPSQCKVIAALVGAGRDRVETPTWIKRVIVDDV